jgi:hypothetical protein
VEKERSTTLGLAKPLSYTHNELCSKPESIRSQQHGNGMSKNGKISAAALVTLSLCGLGCAKRVGFAALPPARSGKATARIELTYNRNDSLEVKLSGVPDPAAIKSDYTCYVLWVSTPDNKSITNAGRIRVEGGKASLVTLTPQRKFLLSITAEPSGEVTSPGPDLLFQTKEINW